MRRLPLIPLTLLAVLPLLIARVQAAEELPHYQVDTAGGSLTLHEEVSDAFAAWQAAGAPEVPAGDDSGDVLFSWGSPERFGPDTFSLTVQRPEARPSLEVFLSDEAGAEQLRTAALHEAGIVLGLAPATEGVLNPALRSSPPQEPTEADVALLLSRLGAVPGDLTGDGIVDFRDLAELAAAYGERGLNLPADLDGDGEVTADDARLLREHYTFTEPAAPAEPEEDDAEAADEAEVGDDGGETGESP